MQKLKESRGRRESRRKEGGRAVTLHVGEGRGASPIKRSCICSTYSQQILIYGRAIKLVLNLSTVPPYNYIHRACVKRVSDLASSAGEEVCVTRHECTKKKKKYQ